MHFLFLTVCTTVGIYMAIVGSFSSDMSESKNLNKEIMTVMDAFFRS